MTLTKKVKCIILLTLINNCCWSMNEDVTSHPFLQPVLQRSYPFSHDPYNPVEIPKAENNLQSPQYFRHDPYSQCGLVVLEKRGLSMFRVQKAIDFFTNYLRQCEVSVEGVVYKGPDCPDLSPAELREVNNYRDDQGSGVMHAVVRQSHLPLVEFAHERGIDFSQRRTASNGFGETPLFIVVLKALRDNRKLDLLLKIAQFIDEHYPEQKNLCCAAGTDFEPKTPGAVIEDFLEEARPRRSRRVET